eukprot:jgi/Botrbrau1/22863/Bobra.0065s0021.1
MMYGTSPILLCSMTCKAKPFLPCTEVLSLQLMHVHVHLHLIMFGLCHTVTCLVVCKVVWDVALNSASFNPYGTLVMTPALLKYEDWLAIYHFSSCFQTYHACSCSLFCAAHVENGMEGTQHFYGHSGYL